MKLRHVRAVAVFGIAVVALTGARGSHGGACSGSSHSSSSSSGGGSGGAKKIKDVRIETCRYDESRGIVAHVRAKNISPITDYTYTFKVRITAPDGSTLRTSNSTMPEVAADSTEYLDVAAAYTPSSGETGRSGRCKLLGVTRSIA